MWEICASKRPPSQSGTSKNGQNLSPSKRALSPRRRKTSGRRPNLSLSLYFAPSIIEQVCSEDPGMMHRAPWAGF
ncbi:hypothetical protein JTE90_020695 [Oedothorax gibbosus]|uniref:Uncharacterized protein n=1 Tax=Oedothorax gibbosus TaxID=931172 RepID=A0AAV6V6H0_9ARAC|nr:hypothetical protein JTE90_020695 [Oedothorax gibbosus]